VTRFSFRALIATGAAMMTGLALAHHSGAMFDATRTQVITGKVTEFNWVNPHSSFKVEVAGAGGKPEIWAIEMNTPQNLVRSGWKRTTIKAGDQVTVTVRPLRDGKPGGSYMSIKLADGTVLDGAPSQAESYPAQPAAPPAR
jgi:Family of unknown function (DUF6152)